MEIGERIKEIRLKKGLKQSELAEKADISRVAVGNYERGDRIPNIEITQKIAMALGVDINELLGKEEAEQINELTSKLNFHIEHIMRIYGYEIAGDPSEGDILLRTHDGTYEITMDDVNDLRNSTVSFIKYKLQEIKDRSRKIGR